MTSVLLLLALLCPVFTGLLSLIWPYLKDRATVLKKRIPNALALGSILELIITYFLAVQVHSGVVLEVPELQIRVDGQNLGSLMIVVIVFFLTSLYHLKAKKEERLELNWYNFFVLLFLSCIIGLLLSQDLLAIYFFSELLIGSSIMLVLYHRGQNASEASLKFAVIMIFGSIFYSLGIAIIITVSGTTNLSALLQDAATRSALVENPPVLMFAIGCIIIAFSIKLGLFPFQGWLPDVYVALSPPVIGFFCIKPIPLVLAFYNLIFPLFQIYPNNTIFLLLIGLGLISSLFGALFAYPQKNFIRMLAYCQISVFGIIIFVFGLILTQISAPANASIGIYYLLNSTLMKVGLFLSLGFVLIKTNIQESDALGGLFSTVKVIGISYVVCALSLVGLPPLSGFQAKWLILNLTFQCFYLLGGIFLALAMLFLLACLSLIELAYLIRAFHQIFFGVPPSQRQLIDKGEVHPLNWFPPLFIAIIAVVLGLFPDLLF